MTLQDLGSIGELLAAIATIATLGYLAVQLRQNTATVRASTAAASSQVAGSLNTLLVDPDNNQLFWTGLNDPSSLDESETRRFHVILNMAMENAQQGVRFHREGVLDDEAWIGQQRSLRWFVGYPGFRQYWDVYGSMHHRGFARIVDEYLASDAPAESDS